VSETSLSKTAVGFELYNLKEGRRSKFSCKIHDAENISAK